MLRVLRPPLAHRGHWARFLARRCSFARTKKKIGSPGGASSALFNFSLDLGRLGSTSGPADAPELDFGVRNGTIYDRVGRSHAFHVNFARTQQNTVKTDTKRISWLPHDNTKTAANRSADVRDTARCSELAWTLLRDGPGASGDCATNPFRQFAGSLGTPRASLDRSWDGSRATRTRHKRGLERLQNSLERPKLPTIEFLFIFGSN